MLRPEIRNVLNSLAGSTGRRNTYYKLSMWSDDYEEEVCTGWVYSRSKE